MTRRYGSQLNASVPEGWVAKETIALLAPGGEANVIVSAEPINPGIDAQRYAELQSVYLQEQFPGYAEICFSPREWLGGRQGFVRTFAWLPPDGERVTQIQLYYAESGLGYTATATASSTQFERIELQLWQVLDGLDLGLGNVSWAPEYRGGEAPERFDHRSIDRYLRKVNYRFLRDQDDHFQVRFSRDEVSQRELTAWFSAEGAEDSVYAIRVYADKAIPASKRDEALEVCNAWNEKWRWPRAVLRPDGPDADSPAHIVLDCHVDLREGVHQELLDDLTNCAVHYAFEFWKWVRQERYFEDREPGTTAVQGPSDIENDRGSWWRKKRA